MEQPPAPVAAAGRRDRHGPTLGPAAALLVGGWFGAFALAWGASPNVDVGDGTFAVAFVPALPAFSLLVVSVPLLVPTLPSAPGTARARRRHFLE